MLQETPDELLCRQSAALENTGAVIAGAESNMVAIKVFEAAVGDSNAEKIARDVVEDVLGDAIQQLGFVESVADLGAEDNGQGVAEGYSFRDAPSRARRVIQHGDVIWSCVRPNRRSHALIWQPSPDLIVSTGFAVITPKTLPTSFVYQATTTDVFVGLLENQARGAAYPAVVAGDLERAAILVPAKLLVDAFNDFSEPLLDQTNNLHAQNWKLRAARDLLLSRLMSGEIAV